MTWQNMIHIDACDRLSVGVDQNMSRSKVNEDVAKHAARPHVEELSSSDSVVGAAVPYGSMSQ